MINQNFECQSPIYKQDTKLNIHHYENKFEVMFLLIYIMNVKGNSRFTPKMNLTNASNYSLCPRQISLQKKSA